MNNNPSDVLIMSRNSGDLGVFDIGFIHRGRVRAVAQVVDCLGPRDETLWKQGEIEQKLVGQERSFVRYRQSFAWVIAHVRVRAQSVPYVHPQGAVIWVNLVPAVQCQVQEHLLRASSVPLISNETKQYL